MLKVLTYYFPGERLCSLFDAIPSDVEAAMVEEVHVNWVEAHHLLDTSDRGEGGDKNRQGKEGNCTYVCSR